MIVGGEETYLCIVKKDNFTFKFIFTRVSSEAQSVPNIGWRLTFFWAVIDTNAPYSLGKALIGLVLIQKSRPRIRIGQVRVDVSIRTKIFGLVRSDFGL